MLITERATDGVEMLVRSVLLGFIVSVSYGDSILPTSSGNNGTVSKFQGVLTSLHDMDVNKTELIDMLGVGGLRGLPDKKQKTRFKRQHGGKYVQASQMGQTKLMRLVLQMIKNTFAPTYVGGPHPLHHVVPAAFMQVLKEGVLDYFTPDVNAEPRVAV